MSLSILPSSPLSDRPSISLSLSLTPLSFSLSRARVLSLSHTHISLQSLHKSASASFCTLSPLFFPLFIFSRATPSLRSSIVFHVSLSPTPILYVTYVVYVTYLLLYVTHVTDMLLRHALHATGNDR